MLGDKTLLEKGTYHQGLKDGIWYSWHENGALKSISSYQEGLLSGPFLYFDRQGKIVQTGAYRKGKPHATWISYDGAVKTGEKKYKKGALLEKDTLQRKAVELFQSKLAD